METIIFLSDSSAITTDLYMQKELQLQNYLLDTDHIYKCDIYNTKM